MSALITIGIFTCTKENKLFIGVAYRIYLQENEKAIICSNLSKVNISAGYVKQYCGQLLGGGAEKIRRQKIIYFPSKWCKNIFFIELFLNVILLKQTLKLIWNSQVDLDLDCRHNVNIHILLYGIPWNTV